jgi:glutamyl-tRNA synthetase
MKTRMAPTPSGYLHAGNGAAFVLAWRLARESGGKLLLRIDDLDAERIRPAFVEDVFATLQWLGVDWDEGPRSSGDLALWTQHRRLGNYHTLLQELRTANLVYACSCTRKEVAERGCAVEYDGLCRKRNLSLDAADVVWRLRLPEHGRMDMRMWPRGAVQRMALDLPDPVVRQRTVRPAYQIASLADDLYFGVDTVVRGMDLLHSSLLQLFMAEKLGYTAFTQAVFLHHPLLVGPTGEKLSKSAGAASLKDRRESGRGPQEVLELADYLRRSALS